MSLIFRPDAFRFWVQRLLTWTPAILLTLNVLVTAWFVFAIYPMEQEIYSDMSGYERRAREISQGVYGSPQFFQPIGYSLWLALWRWLAGGEWWLIKLTHVAMVWLSVFLGWRVARRILRPNWDLLALAFMSLHAQWWALAGFALSETLYTFLITVLLWSTVRWVERPGVLHAAITGLSFGLAFFVKGTAAFFPIFLGLWCLVRVVRGRAPLKSTMAHLAVMGLFAFTVAVAHGSFALAKYGQFRISAADAGALNFIEGKCPWKDNTDGDYRWFSTLFFQLGEREKKVWDVPFSNQPYYWRQGWQCIKDDPVVLVTSLRYVYYLYAGNRLWPLIGRGLQQRQRWDAYEAWIASVIFPLTMIGLFVALRRWERPETAAALLYLSLWAIVWVFKSELRFRVPFDAITMILATLGAMAVVAGVRAICSHSHSDERATNNS
jgi:4-amino-4-deoxy-L-arabinose transferase-like glycosyltransferase